MIVKNSADTIRPCLHSVAGLVHQIVIADTGCTDSTCDIAREFGATIVSFPWQNHFADARNAALAAITTDWVLVLDADEELDRAAALSLPALLAAVDVGGYHVPIREYVPFRTGSAWTFVILPNDSDLERAKVAQGYFQNSLCRLFRRRADIYFTGRVHEIVQPQISRAGLQLATAPFCIHHFGHLANQQERAVKIAFYSDLLQERLKEDPDNVTTWTLCAQDALEVHGDPFKALQYLKEALIRMPNGLEPLLLAANTLCILERYHDALRVLADVGEAEIYPHFLFMVRARAHYALDHFAEAHRDYSNLLAITPDDRSLQAKVDYIEVRLGAPERAIASLQLAASELPGLVEIHEFLVNAYIHTGRIAEAADEAERYCKVDPREAFLLKAARLRAELQGWDRAEALALECLALYPPSREACELLMMAHVAGGRLTAAAAVAEALTYLVAEPQSFLRAASIYVQLNDARQASQCLVRGLTLFQDSELLQCASAEVSRPSPVTLSIGPGRGAGAGAMQAFSQP